MITVENLTKRYGSFTAVDDISFEVAPGSVVGFLGPNGAGKSTAMRMMTGLTPPTSGRSMILGRDYRQLPNPARHVGVMLDAAAQHPGRTGKEVLNLIGMTIGAPKTRVDQSLQLVGLTPQEAKRRVRNYSLGMRQRLGLAGALMGDPQVLILDEPANGLDPQGIHWMRQLLRAYADQGGTVLLSSHLLRAGIEVSGDRTGLLVKATPEAVGRIALEAGIVLTELHTTGSEGLEQLFLSLTAADARDAAAA